MRDPTEWEKLLSEVMDWCAWSMLAVVVISGFIVYGFLVSALLS